MKQAYEMTDWAERYEAMRRNRGELARQITEDRFEDMLGVLPPANWTRGDNFECFMVDECQTADLFTWCAWLETDGQESFWEMIAPRSSTPEEIHLRIVIGQRHA